MGWVKGELTSQVTDQWSGEKKVKQTHEESDILDSSSLISPSANRRPVD